MSDELKDILSNLNKEAGQEKLLEYLSRNMSDEAQHEFEKSVNDDEFISDAVEGLDGIHDKQQLQLLVGQLNLDLKKQIAKKKNRRTKRKPAEQTWTWFAIIFIILFIIIGYLVIRQFIEA